MIPNEGFAQEQFEPERTLDDYASSIRLVFEGFVTRLLTETPPNTEWAKLGFELKLLIDSDTAAEIIATARKVEERE